MCLNTDETSKLNLKFDDSKEDLIELVKRQMDNNNGVPDCRLLTGYGKDCLNKNLLGLLHIKQMLAQAEKNQDPDQTDGFIEPSR